MEISAINNQNFKGVTKAGVKVLGELSTYPQEMLNKCYGEVDTFARNYGRQVKIAEKGKSLIVNSGLVTSSFTPEKLSNPERDFAQKIIENIRANNIAEARGLQKGLDYLA